MIKALVMVYLVLVALLAGGCAYLWRLRCEGFGCTGVGVAWLAWAALFLPTLGVGFALRSRTSIGAVLRRVVGAVVGLQVLAGVALLVAWGMHRAA